MGLPDVVKLILVKWTKLCDLEIKCLSLASFPIHSSVFMNESEIVVPNSKMKSNKC